MRKQQQKNVPEAASSNLKKNYTVQNETLHTFFFLLRGKAREKVSHVRGTSHVASSREGQLLPQMITFLLPPDMFSRDEKFIS